MKRFKLLSLCIGIILALLVGEFAARCYYFVKASTNTLIPSKNKTLRYEHKPSITFVNKFGITMKYNSLGLIGDEVGEKARDTIRIMGLGDSITEAHYLPESQRYLNRTGALLKQKTKQNIEIINAGVTGYNTWQELELLKMKNPVVKSDIILVGICLNDFLYTKIPRVRQSWFNRMKFRGITRARYFNFLYQRSDLYRFLYDFLSLIRRVWLGSMKDFYRYHEQYSLPKPSDFEKWKEPLEEMITYARENKIKIFFVIFPVDFQLHRNRDATFKPLSDFFNKEGVPFLDLMEILKKNYSEEKPLFKGRDFIHPSAIGHSIAAEAITGYIIEHKIISRGRENRN